MNDIITSQPIPEWRPNNPSQWDDEFDDKSLSSKWQRRIYDIGSGFDDNNNFYKLVENVNLSALSLENIAPTDNTIRYQRYYQPAPAPPWRIQCDVEMYTSVTTGLPSAGLSVVGNSTLSYEMMIQNNTQKELRIQSTNSSDHSFVGNIGAVSLGSTNELYTISLNRIRFQIRYNGSILFFDRAIGGNHFSGYTNWTSTAMTNGVNRIGFILSNRTSINWFRVKTDSARYAIDID